MMERIKGLFKMWVSDDTDPLMDWYVWRPWTVAVGHGFLGALGAMIVVVPAVLVLR